MARRPKFTLDPSIQARLCDAIKAGMTRERAAYYVGISEKTFYNWIAKGEKAQRGKYHEFLQALKKAEAEGIAINLKNLHSAAAAGAWQASAWILERRHPKEYGKNQIDETPGTAKSIAEAMKILRGEAGAKEPGKDNDADG